MVSLAQRFISNKFKSNKKFMKQAGAELCQAYFISNKFISNKKFMKQAGAELCQA